MKNLALATIACGALSGCIIEDGYGYEEFGIIDSSWAFHTVSGDSLACPAPFTTTAITSRSLSGFAPIVDLYDCNDRFAVAEFPLDLYDVDITVSSRDGRNVYARSLINRVDIIDFDVAIGEDFIHDGGRILLDWTLVDATNNNPLTCATAGVDRVELTTTGAAGASTQTFRCEDRLDEIAITNPLLADDYTVTVKAIGFDDQQLGDPQNSTLTVAAPNGYAETGVITLPIQNLRAP
jgi:hypothetical protein